METNPATPERTYHGHRDDENTCHVRAVGPGNLAGRPLAPRLDLAHKSPTGFEWGYGGSGPAQLALALCADALGDDEAALDLFQLFKDRVIAALPRDEPWTLAAGEVRRHCRELQAEAGRTRAMSAVAQARTDVLAGTGQVRLRSGQADPGRLDWFTSAVLPDGGRRVRICRCARSTPTETVELDRGTSALLLAALGELAQADPAVSWPAARQAVLRAFHAWSAPNP